MKRFTAWILSVVMFLGVISYAGVALAEGLNRITVRMSVTDAILDVDEPQTSGDPMDVSIQKPAPIPTADLPLPETPAAPEPGQSQSPYDSGADADSTDPDRFTAADPTSSSTQEELTEVLGELGVTPAAGADYLIETTGVQISADQSAAVLTQNVSTPMVQYKKDANGAFERDGQGNLIEETVNVPVGAIEVTLEAEAMGSTKVFSVAEESEIVYEARQKNVVLAIDLSYSMKQGNNIQVAETGNSQGKWEVLCEAVRSLVAQVYGSTYDAATKTWSEPANKNVSLDLVIVGGAAPITVKNKGKTTTTYQSADMAAEIKSEGVSTLTEMTALLDMFTGRYQQDMENFEYAGLNNGDGINGKVVDGMWDDQGTNTEAGYRTALEAVQTIKQNNQDNSDFDSEDITVVYMTDGESNQYIDDKNGDGKKEESAPGTFDQAGAAAASAAVEILKEGVNLVNVVINDDVDNHKPDGVTLDDIENYMDPGHMQDNWQRVSSGKKRAGTAGLAVRLTEPSGYL